MTTEENTSGAQFQFSPNGESDWSDTQRKTDSYMRFVFNITSYSNAIKLPGSDPEWPLVWPANMFPQDIAATKWSNITALPEADNSSYNYPVFNVDHASTEGLGLFLLEIPDKTEAMIISITAQPANALASGNNMEWLADFCIYRDGVAEGVISTVSLGNTAFNPTGQTTSSCKLSLAKLTDGTLTAQAGDRIAFAVYPNTTSAVSPKQTDWQVSCIKFDVLEKEVIDYSSYILHYDSIMSGDVDLEGTWKNQVGNSYDAILEGNSYVIEGSGIYFDGNSDRAYTTENIGISGNAPSTFAAWIYPETVSSSRYGISICHMGVFSSNTMRSIGLLSGGNSLGYDNGTLYLQTFNNAFSTNTVIPTEEWTHIAVVCGETYINFYVNGNLVHSEVGVMLNTSDSNLILSNYSSTYSWNSFQGYMDDIRLIGTDISENDVKIIYNQKNLKNS